MPRRDAPRRVPCADPCGAAAAVAVPERPSHCCPVPHHCGRTRAATSHSPNHNMQRSTRACTLRACVIILLAAITAASAHARTGTGSGHPAHSVSAWLDSAGAGRDHSLAAQMRHPAHWPDQSQAQPAIDIQRTRREKRMRGGGRTTPPTAAAAMDPAVMQRLKWTEEAAEAEARSTHLSPPTRVRVSPPPSPLSVSSCSSPRSADCVLREFFYLSDGPNWLKNDGWDSDLPVCQWYGIGCSKKGNITSITLDSNKLLVADAAVALDSLSSLTHLKSLSFMFNSISGQFPASFANLTRLVSIAVRSNKLHGEWPPFLASLTHLDTIDLSSNNFTGPLDPSVCISSPNITHMYLSRNRFSGGVSEEWSACTLMTAFDVSFCDLSGPLPDSLGTINLGYLFIQHNTPGLSGPLALDKILSPSIRLLMAGDNQFTSVRCGYTPFAQLLTTINLAGNALNDTLSDLMECFNAIAPWLSSVNVQRNNISWSGEQWDPALFPAALLGSLYNLDISSNRIGPGSAEYFLGRMFWLGQLFILSVANNQLCGPLPLVAASWIGLDVRNNPVFLLPSNAAVYNGTDAFHPNATELLSPAVCAAQTTSISSLQSTPYEIPFWMIIDQSSWEPQTHLNLTCPSVVGTAVILSVDPEYLRYIHCSCIPNHARDPMTFQCVPCPAELQCSNSTTAPQHKVRPGYFPFPKTPTEYNNNVALLVNATYVACFPANSCGGEDATQSSDSSAFRCSPGRDSASFLCSKCVSGSFLFHDSCESCGDPASVWIIPVSLLFAVFVGITAIMTLFLRAAANKEAKRVAQAKKAELMGTNKTRLGMEASVVQQLSGLRLSVHSEPKEEAKHETKHAAAAGAMTGHAVAAPASASAVPARGTPLSKTDKLVRRFARLLLTGSRAKAYDRSMSSIGSWAVFEVVLFWIQMLGVLQQFQNNKHAADAQSQQLAGDGSAAASEDSASSDVIAVVAQLLRVSPFALDCFATSFDFSITFWLYATAPLWTCVVVFFIYKIVSVIYPRATRTPSRVQVNFDRKRFDQPPLTDDQWKQHQRDLSVARQNHCKSASVKLLELILNILYMQIAISCFQVWNCVAVENPSLNSAYLSAHPYIECGTSSHHAMQAASIVVLLTFVVAFPIAIFWASMHHSRQVRFGTGLDGDLVLAPRGVTRQYVDCNLHWNNTDGLSTHRTFILTRDLHLRQLFVPIGVTLVAGKFKIYCSESCSVNGQIDFRSADKYAEGAGKLEEAREASSGPGDDSLRLKAPLGPGGIISAPTVRTGRHGAVRLAATQFADRSTQPQSLDGVVLQARRGTQIARPSCCARASAAVNRVWRSFRQRLHALDERCYMHFRLMRLHLTPAEQAELRMRQQPLGVVRPTVRAPSRPDPTQAELAACETFNGEMWSAFMDTPLQEDGLQSPRSLPLQASPLITHKLDSGGEADLSSDAEFHAGAPISSSVSPVPASLFSLVQEMFVVKAEMQIRPEFMIWQLVLPLRKGLVTAFVYLIPRTSPLLPVAVMLLLLCQLAIQASNFPYRRVLDNRMEEVLTGEESRAQRCENSTRRLLVAHPLLLCVVRCVSSHVFVLPSDRSCESDQRRVFVIHLPG